MVSALASCARGLFPTGEKYSRFKSASLTSFTGMMLNTVHQMNPYTVGKTLISVLGQLYVCQASYMIYIFIEKNC